MGVRLTGLLTGIAEGLSDKIAQERNTTNTILASKTKNAYENYLKAQDEKAAIKEEIKKRDAQALVYQNDLTEAQRIAIASDTTNTYLSQYQKLLAAGNPYNRKLSDLIKLDDKSPTSNFADWEKSVTEPAVPKTQPQPLEQTSMFAPSADYQQRQYSKLSSTVGLSPDELMAYEKPVEMPKINQTASINLEMITMPKSRDEVSMNLFDALRIAKTPEEVQAAKDNIAKFSETSKEFDKLYGNTDYSAMLNDRRAEVALVLSEPQNYPKEQVDSAKRFYDSEVAREVQTRRAYAEASKASSTFDISSSLTSAIKLDLDSIPTRSVNGQTAYFVGKDQNGKDTYVNETDPRATNIISAAKIGAVNRILAAAGMLKEDGSLSVENKARVTLAALNIPISEYNGKEYVGNKLSAIRRSGGTEEVVKIIKAAVDAGKTYPELATKFTKAELDAAGVVPPVQQPTTTAPENTTSETAFERKKAEVTKQASAASEAKKKAEEQASAASEAKKKAEDLAREEERKRRLSERPDLSGLMARPFMVK